MRKTWAAWMIIGVVVSAGSRADETPSMGRGIAQDKLYQTGEIDSVDLQSGAVAVSIPIGRSYPLSERFSYSFVLTNTSRLWDFQPAQSGYIATLNPRANAGIGWSLHMGLLIHPQDPDNPAGTTQWKYISPDGGEHLFFDQLHDSDNESDPTNSTEYTRDSTYLRLRHLGGDVHEVDFPDGTTRNFEPTGTAFTYRLHEIRDRFLSGGTPSNWVRFDYSTALKWTVSDSRGRSHVVKFVSIPYGGASRPMVDYVDLAAFDGSAGRWNFVYVNDNGATSIWRDCRDNAFDQVDAPVLASVARPDGANWSFQTYDECPGPEGSGRFASRSLRPTRASKAS